MPALLWGVFWSSLMGSAACLDETRQPVDPPKPDPANDD